MAGHRPFSELQDKLDARRAQPLKPYRGELAVTFVARDAHDAEAQYGRLVEAATVLGFNFEHGSSEQMDAADVIADSPIDHRLRAST